MVAVAQQPIVGYRPFLVESEERVVSKDYATRCIARLHDASSRGLYDEIAKSVRDLLDYDALASQLLLERLRVQNLSYLCYSVSVRRTGQVPLGLLFEVMFSV